MQTEFFFLFCHTLQENKYKREQISDFIRLLLNNFHDSFIFVQHKNIFVHFYVKNNLMKK
jgi:hypothetical protein